MIRLTMAQALIRFLANQYVVMDGKEYPFIAGIFGIFGHGNVTGLGEALEFSNPGIKFYQGHNEQGMAHAAIAFAKQSNRLQIMPCTSSIGPGATNMVTAAATATTNRIPLLLLPGDVFACRQPDPVLQQLELAHDYTISVNDCFKPVSKYWDRISRPEQLMSACMNAMRVLTDSTETGAVTLCLPQDVQAESYEYDTAFFDKRLWFIDREAVSERAINKAAELINNAKHPLIIAGGGVHYSLATTTLADFAHKHQIPVAETQAGKSALAATNQMNVGGIGVTGSEVANCLAAQADVVLVVGSRLQDFTTASKWAFQNPDCQFIHINCARFDAMKMNALMLKGDAKLGLEQLSKAIEHYLSPKNHQELIATYQEQWAKERTRVQTPKPISDSGLEQTAVLKIINAFTNENDVIIGAAGSLPGDLHRLWQSKQAKDYHLEYAYSCMGYEVAAGLGVRLAKGDEGEVYVFVGDGSFIMLHSELITCIQEHKKITVLLFDNHGFQCIRSLQQAHGSQGFGNEFRFRSESDLSGEYVPIDFKMYAQALGATAYFASSYEILQECLMHAKNGTGVQVIVIPVCPKSMSKGYNTWWRVGVAQVSESKEVNKAYETMTKQISLLG